MEISAHVLRHTMLRKAADSDAFHVRCSEKEMGQQSAIIFESILPFMEALEVYTTMATEAVVEVVSPTNPSRQIIGIIDEDSDG